MKTYEATKLSNVILSITVPHEENGKYYAGELSSHAVARTDDGKLLDRLKDDITLGTEKDIPWTPKEIYDYFDNLCSPLAAKLKFLYQEGINVDPSI